MAAPTSTYPPSVVRTWQNPATPGTGPARAHHPGTANRSAEAMLVTDDGGDGDGGAVERPGLQQWRADLYMCTSAGENHRLVGCEL